MGIVDPKIPVVMVVNLSNGLNENDAYDSIYGELHFQYKKRHETNQIVEEGYTRKENSFYHEKNSEIVTTIATYNRDTSKDDPLVGKLHDHPRTPKNPMSKEFRLRLRNALFGNSESSDWRSLTKIEDINEKIAKELYDNGIEDLNILAMAEDKELEIDEFDKLNLLAFRDEARRIIYALMTNSIRFIKGINQENFDILTENGIYLINQLVEEELTELIDEKTIKIILEDKNRILD